MYRLKVLAIIVLLASACAKTPPNLTPEATAAFKGMQVIKALDVLRDAAIAANDIIPPLVSTDSTRKVVLYHKGAITIIHGTPEGWKPTVVTGLDELQRALPANERVHLNAYVELLKTLIAEVK